MRRALFVLCLCLAPALAAPSVAEADDGVLRVTFMDAHSGVVLETPSGRVYVVDPDRKVDERIAAYLRSRGVSRIDGVIVTHRHRDHFLGVPLLLRTFRVRRVHEPGYTLHAHPEWGRKLLPALRRARVELRSGLRAGGRLDLDPGLQVKVLGPQTPYIPSAGTPERLVNENSLVLWIRHGQVACMLPGDAAYQAQAAIAARYPQETRETNVLYLPHHGRHYVDPGFLALVGSARPAAAVAFASSSALPETLGRWRAAAPTIYEANRHGRVTIVSTGRGFVLRTSDTGLRRRYRLEDPSGGISARLPSSLLDR